jgi:hypothetical protein
MNLDRFVSQMADQARTIQSLVTGISSEQARWKPAPDSWSLLEVINHLADEEEGDFRPRLDITLHRPDQPWTPIDPGGWVTERRYNERELDGSLDRFLRLRQDSVRWLRGLASPNWAASYEAPWGPIRAGDLFAAWVAHDLLHTRQLVELHWAYTLQQVSPYRVRYAGDW